MSGTTPALIAAAAGVGLGHAILPDHWVPLSVLGRTRRYRLARVARLSALAGVAHVLVSIILGAAIIAVGLQFRSTVQSAQDTIIGTILILTGVGFAAMQLTGHGHHHEHDHGHHDDHDLPHDRHHCGEDEAARDQEDDHRDRSGAAVAALDRAPSGSRETGRGARGIAAVMVPFGAAASPDLTILPVFLAATASGVATAIGSLIVFAAVTIATIVGLTLFACFGGHQVHGEWLDRYGNALTAFTLIAIGTLVITHVI